MRDELTRLVLSLVELSLLELSFEELSLAELSFAELSLVEPSDLDFSSFFESYPPPSELGAWDLFAPPMLEETRRRSFTFRTTATRIEKGELGNEAGIYGAAYLPWLPETSVLR